MDKREKVLKGLEICKEESKLCFGESECGYQSYFPRCWITLAADALELLKAQEPQWTPITLRPLTKEEKAEHPDWCYIIDSPTPDDGDEILVSDGKNVWADVWGNNGTECYLESDHELEGVAWMKMPTPWRKEANQ